MDNLSLPTLYRKAIIGLILIQLTHKAVHEIPGLVQIGQTSVWIYNSIQILLYFTGIVLLLVRKDLWSLLPGFVSSILLMVQPALRLLFILLHIKVDDHGGVWWYPIFPLVQGGLILYFTWLAFHENRTRLLKGG